MTVDKRRSFLLVVVAIVAAVAAALIMTIDRGSRDAKDDCVVVSNGVAGKPRVLGRGGKTSEKVRREKPKLSNLKRRAQDDSSAAELDDDMSPEDRKLADAIEKALDDEDLSAACALAAKAASSTNSDVRESMVNTLGWFGVKALPELTPFLADQDESVRESAMGEWSRALSEIEDDGEKISIVELAMHALADDDMLEDVSSEYIGIDEKLAVESLLRVIESGGTEAGIAKAKETYEFVTGEEFTDRADAEKWIAEEYKQSRDE